MLLQTLTDIPEGLLDCEAIDLQRFLDGPTLLDLTGQKEAALFISVLLHGNETSGWNGLRRYLREHPAPPRNLIIFIGNVRAAASQMRALPDQPDYNRIWRDADGEGGALAAEMEAAIAGRELWAAVDLHNNTGRNPYYSVLTNLEPHTLGLAQLFSNKAVYIEEPDTVLTRIFDTRCPAVALEVGPVGDDRCTDRVYDYLQRCIELDAVPVGERESVELFRTVVRVHVPSTVAFRFEGDLKAPNDVSTLVLTGGMEAVNFHEVPAGTPFGVTSGALGDALHVLDAAHRDVTSEFFAKDGDEILVKRSVVPAMYTTDPFVVKQDCLCYFMERMEPRGG